jgi:hypothetical protein
MQLHHCALTIKLPLLDSIDMKPWEGVLPSMLSSQTLLPDPNQVGQHQYAVLFELFRHEGSQEQDAPED